MKFSAAVVLAAAAGASAYGYGGNVTVITEVVDSYTTYCPGPTTITHGSMTYTVTEATTLTITDCPCTITKPCTTSTEVVCSTCTPTVLPPAPTGGYTPVKPPTVPTDVPGAAGKAVAVSGGALAGVLGIAAFLL